MYAKSRAGLIIVVCLIALSATALLTVQANGWTLYYGDAEAHLAIARRIVDSRTPGYDQVGTVWLPLPHFLMLPLVVNDWLWRTGLAGAIPNAVCFVLAGWFLFAAARQAFNSPPAAVAAVACFVLNPNLLYLQATPMTEAVFFASLTALLFCTLAFARRQSRGFVFAAGGASLAASLTRYEGWFLIPFVTLFFLLASKEHAQNGRATGGFSGEFLGWFGAAGSGLCATEEHAQNGRAAGGDLRASKRHRLAIAILFGAIASLGPLYWLAHNWWYFGDALEFYRGQYSPRAIQGGKVYPGLRDWAKAWLYYRSTVEIAAGWGAVALSLGGMIAAVSRRLWWPLAFLALVPAFYVWSMHSSGGTPIFIPTLWPNTYYNSRYGLAALPLLAFCVGALVLSVPVRFRPAAAACAVLISIAPWLASPRPDAWVCWKESQVNSEARRAWTHQAARYMAVSYRPGAGIFSTIGDMAGVFREAGIPFREVLQEGNEPAWQAALARPDLFLHETWALAIGGDPIAKAAAPPQYQCVRIITVKDAPTITILKRNRK